MSDWQPIETAPRGIGEDGPKNINHPDDVTPPRLLLFTEECMVVGYYDWCYPLGYWSGGEIGQPAWRGNFDGEPIYGATHWMLLPEGPK